MMPIVQPLLTLTLLVLLPLRANGVSSGGCRLHPGSVCLAEVLGPVHCSSSGGECDRCIGYFVGGRYNADVTRSGCACLCHRLGYDTAGVENGNNCFCGNATAPRSHCGKSPLPAQSCAVPCNGNKTSTCGGSMAVEVYTFDCDSSCVPIVPGLPPPPPSPRPPPAPPPPPAKTYPWQPTIHWAQGCLEGRVTHDISGGIIQSDGTFHAWIGCFNAQPGGGWQHVVSRDLLSWSLAAPFTATALPPFKQGRHIEAGAVGLDDDGNAFAVEGFPGGSGTGPYNAYRFSNASNNAWAEPVEMFQFFSTRGLPGDPPRPWRDPRNNRWYIDCPYLNGMADAYLWYLACLCFMPPSGSE
jgi:hypothetical protein